MGKGEQMLTVTQAAQIAGYNPSALRNVILAGALPATKVGNAWIIYRSELDKWMSGPNYRSGPGRPRKDT